MNRAPEFNAEFAYTISLFVIILETLDVRLDYDLISCETLYGCLFGFLDGLKLEFTGLTFVLILISSVCYKLYVQRFRKNERA